MSSFFWGTEVHTVILIYNAAEYQHFWTSDAKTALSQEQGKQADAIEE